MSSSPPEGVGFRGDKLVGPLPDLDTAQATLGRRYLRAVVWLLIRTVGLALLEAVFLAEMPGIRALRGLLDMVAGILVLWPFFVVVSRIYGQRILLGKRYLEAQDSRSAVAILSPVEGWRARFFDLTGEGGYWRGVALRAEKQETAAVRAWESVRQTGGEWGRRAEEALKAPAAKEQNS